MKWTKIEEEKLLELYPKIKPKEISNIMNRSIDSIWNKIKLLKIEHRSNKRHQEFELDFNNISHMYILGLLWADGYLHKTLDRLELSITSDDFKDVSSLFDEKIWAMYERKRKNKKTQTTVGIYKKNICSYFRNELNFSHKSSNSPSFLNKIDKSNLKYFVRGFFDGDGCFYIGNGGNQKQCSLSGTYSQDWSWLETILKDLNISYSIKKKIQNENSKYSILYIKKKGVKDFCKYIYYNYTDDRIGLKRKYEKSLYFN